MYVYIYIYKLITRGALTGALKVPVIKCQLRPVAVCHSVL